MIVLPGGGYAEHAEHEAEPIADWLETLGVHARVFRYPLNVRHLLPLEAVRAEVRRRRDAGVERVGIVGFSAALFRCMGIRRSERAPPKRHRLR